MLSRMLRRFRAHAPMAHAPVAQSRAKRLPLRDLAHQPCDPLPEMPPESLTPWPVPAWMRRSSEPHIRVLCELYDNPLTFPASLSPEAGLLLHALALNLRPRLVIETGTFLGISSIWMAAALRELGAGARVETFDRFGPIDAGPWRATSMPYDRLGFIESAVERAGFQDLVGFHRGDSASTMQAFLSDHRDGTSLCFLDADHTYEGVLRDVSAVAPHLLTGGYIILHDTFPDVCGWTGPRALINQINRLGLGAYTHVDLCLAPTNFGMTVLRKVG